MHWGVFAISAAHLYLPKLPWRAPPPPPTLVRLVKAWMNVNVIDKNQLIWKLFIYWYLMSFFHKYNVTKCLGHYYAIWTSDSNFFGPASGWPSIQPLNDVYHDVSLSIYVNLSWRSLWSWSYGSWIYNYLCNQCLSPLMWVRNHSWRGVLDTTLCDKVRQLLKRGRWFSSGTPDSLHQ